MYIDTNKFMFGMCVATFSKTASCEFALTKRATMSSFKLIDGVGGRGLGTKD